MEQVRLFPLNHKRALQIGIAFKFDNELKTHIKQLTDLNWSRTHSCFYVPFTQKNKAELYWHLKKVNCEMDYSRLQSYKLEVTETQKILKFSASDHVDTMREFESYLNGNRYSQSTVDTYCHFVSMLLKFLKKPVSEFTNRDIELFVEKEIAAPGYSISTHRQCISALKHFADLHEQSQIDSDKLKRPDKSKYLPVVLSKEQVIDLLRATRNLKHRAVLALIYSSGLRVGELLSLQIKEIDVDRKQILIKNGKGRKDRYVMLAESFIPLLLNYLGTYRPEKYFVEGQEGEVYSSSSVRMFLKIACRRAKINKKVTPHTLRHSYATHMLENGIDLRYIQELLGHSRPETTMIYTHVTQRDLMKIRSPLDVTLGALAKTANTDENLRLSRNILE